MRWAGTSSVVTASTSVDLPEPMSPVSSALRPSARSVQTRPSKVPQLKTSSRCRRKPDRLSSAAKSSGSDSLFIACLCPALQLCPVGRQPRLELRQPLRVDKGLEDAPHLEYAVLRRAAGAGSRVRRPCSGACPSGRSAAPRCCLRAGTRAPARPPARATGSSACRRHRASNSASFLRSSASSRLTGKDSGRRATRRGSLAAGSSSGTARERRKA